MTLFAGAAQVQKAYVGASAVNAIMNSGVNVLGVNGSFPGITDSNLYLPLTSTLVPTRGASTPTFTRATAAWDFDSEGKLNLNIPAGCPRFTGARLVRNIVPASENVQAGGWSKANLTATSATELVENGVNSTHQCSYSPTIVGDYLLRADIKRGVGSTRHVTLEISGTDGARVNFNVDTGASTSTAVFASGALLNYGSYAASAGYTTFWILVRIPTSQSCGIFPVRLLSGLDGAISYAGDSTSSFHVTNIQVENVSGQADQTASEYVSVGVLSAPFHGAGADGCKWFNTEKSGGAIPSATLKGYWAEPSRVNNCLNSRLIPSSSTSINPNWYVSGTVGSELVVNGGFDSDTVWSKGAGWAIAAGVATATASNTQLSQSIGLVSGKTYTITVTATRTAGFCFFSCGSGSANRSREISASGSYTLTVIGSGANATLYVGTSTFTGTVDDISVKESAIQVTQTTGLDNVANSASRLTAAANDATLLQLLTAPTGTRTTSAWIKRVSGSGTVSLTRNGGTGWTDITSSLVTGTWVPVALTSDVGANPTVGLKMGTSGDVIDVDCFQDENGAWRTSPILTTTAAVTRNADVLSYTHAGVFDDAQGTILATANPSSGNNLTAFVISMNDSNSALFKGQNGTQLACDDGTTILYHSAWPNTGNPRKAAVKWTGAVKTACLAGASPTSDAYDGSFNATSLQIGRRGATTVFGGNIGEVHIWTTALTDAQMQQVTT